MLKVVGHRVLIDPELPQSKTDWGFEVVGESLEREKAGTTLGKIVGIGPTAWKAFDDGEPWASLGDKVYFAKYGGKWVVIEGKEYIVINDEDVQAIVQEEE